MRHKLEQKDLPSAGLGREKTLFPPKQGVPVQWNKPCVPLPGCHQLRSSGHKDRSGFPLASCTLSITKQLRLRALAAHTHC